MHGECGLCGVWSAELCLTGLCVGMLWGDNELPSWLIVGLLLLLERLSWLLCTDDMFVVRSWLYVGTVPQC